MLSFSSGQEIPKRKNSVSCSRVDSPLRPFGVAELPYRRRRLDGRKGRALDGEYSPQTPACLKHQTLSLVTAQGRLLDERRGTSPVNRSLVVNKHVVVGLLPTGQHENSGYREALWRVMLKAFGHLDGNTQKYRPMSRPVDSGVPELV